MTPESPRTRRWTRLGMLYFVAATAALIWPVYPAVANRIEPRVLGLPFSFAYVLGVVVANFSVLAALYALRVVDAGEVDVEAEAGAGGGAGRSDG